ncbi:MAG TPA: spermidine/putrescine ABC transporter substrate-binding protein [Acetobacteraceae bacterium]|nr:spermidine/putrescine ABC transporter substrate-binding protein [Acetobacteraceae bacterium]
MTKRFTQRAGLGRRDLIKSAVLGGAAFAGATGFDLAGAMRAFAADSKLAGPLLISNWPYYIAKNTVPDFKAKFGIDVNYVEDINDNDSLFGKIAGPLRMGRNPGRDIIVPTDYMAARVIKLKWAEKFTEKDVPNKKNIEPSLAHPDWDPNREYTLPWATYLTGIAYNIKHTGRELTSINDIYDPAFKGHVSMLNQLRDTMALVFLGMGIDPARATYKDMEAAVEKLKQNVANGQIRQFYGNDYGAALSRGDIWVAFAWSGDVVQLQKDNPDLRFLIPKEGVYRSDDNMLIPLKAPHREAALAWMNYIYDPAVYAQITATIQYVPPVAGTQEFVRKIDPKLADSPLVYPSAATLAKAHDFVKLSAEEDHKWNTLFQTLIGH